MIVRKQVETDSIPAPKSVKHIKYVLNIFHQIYPQIYIL